MGAGRLHTRAVTDGFDFGSIEVLTFDCYGTLIDWEAGILAALRRVIRAMPPDDDSLLEDYARAEARAESGPYRPYRVVLAQALRAVCHPYRVEPTDDEAREFAGSVADWPAFADSAAALEALGKQYALGVITNCDDDLFAASNGRLGGPFRWVITAEEVGSYKPDRRNFEVALDRIGRPVETVMHVAQSLYHDHVPARALGLRTAWIDRRHGRAGFGATPPASASPDLTAPDMATFAAFALAR
jgi:2-haloacid dehalogenase